MYGSNRIEEAVVLCEIQPDPQFQYACATGLFMGLDNPRDVFSFYPCDILRYPSACYRFKSALGNKIRDANETDLCQTQTDEYHVIGCIWGFSYGDVKTPGFDYFTECLHYLPEIGDGKSKMAHRHAACIDGFISARKVDFTPDGFCDDLVDYPLAHNACIQKKYVDLKHFTFSEYEFYNIELLEGDYDPSIVPKSAEWLTKWGNQKPINQQNVAHGGHAH